MSMNSSNRMPQQPWYERDAGGQIVLFGTVLAAFMSAAMLTVTARGGAAAPSYKVPTATATASADIRAAPLDSLTRDTVVTHVRSVIASNGSLFYLDVTADCVEGASGKPVSMNRPLFVSTPGNSGEPYLVDVVPNSSAPNGYDLHVVDPQISNGTANCVLHVDSADSSASMLHEATVHFDPTEPSGLVAIDQATGQQVMIGVETNGSVAVHP